MSADQGGAATPPPSLPTQELIDIMHHHWAELVDTAKDNNNQYYDRSDTAEETETALILAALERMNNPSTPFVLYELINKVQPEEKWLVIGCGTTQEDVIAHVNELSDTTPPNYYVEEHIPEIVTRPKETAE